jgi:hypothetical protein
MNCYSVRRSDPCFVATPLPPYHSEKVRRSRENRPQRRRFGAPSPDRSQEPIAKSPAWCGALGAFEAR